MWYEFKKQDSIVAAGLFVVLGAIWPFLIEKNWFDLIVLIREAIHSGDSGKLVVASATFCVVATVPYVLFFTGGAIAFDYLQVKLEFSQPVKYLLLYLSFCIMLWSQSQLMGTPWEPLNLTLSFLVSLALIVWGRIRLNSILPILLISIQVFFGLQWLTIVPEASKWFIGMTDIPVSIKIASEYLNGIKVLNYMGFSFVVPLLLSSGLTAMLFRANAKNITIAEENFKAAREIETIQSQMMENRLYQEINALAHDLKTPLVTIRGLNSLLSLSKDTTKVDVYSQRIEGAVEKMNDMISSFLYSDSRQRISVELLINYVRAQIPIEDEHLEVSIDMENADEMLTVNKVRLSRALINLLENAILAPNTKVDKHIEISVRRSDQRLIIVVKDDGTGIEADKLDKVWLVGHSGKNTSGLGLPFARQIVEEHSGEITIESEFGVGTSVMVSLPIGEGVN